jgi:charged multivesicular body protein 3
MMKAGLIEEMMNDTMDSVLDTEDMEEETEAEVRVFVCQGRGKGRGGRVRDRVPGVVHRDHCSKNGRAGLSAERLWRGVVKGWEWHTPPSAERAAPH